MQSLLPNGTLGAIGANVQPPVVLDPSSGLVPVVIHTLPEAPVVSEIPLRLKNASMLNAQVLTFVIVYCPDGAANCIFSFQHLNGSNGATGPSAAPAVARQPNPEIANATPQLSLRATRSVQATPLSPQIVD